VDAGREAVLGGMRLVMRGDLRFGNGELIAVGVEKSCRSRSITCF